MLVDKTDLAPVISLHSRNNYGKVTWLKYYAGGQSKNPENLTLSWTTIVRQWIKDIDARAVDNWTDQGSIQLAKLHALGMAFKAICTIVESECYEWNKIKQ